MKVSQIGLISTKIKNLDKQFPIQDMLIQTGQISQFASGIYAYGHIPHLVQKKINDIICKTLSNYNCSELSLPLLQPESIWIESGRLDKYVEDNVMFRCLTEKGNYCLAPTAEEAIVNFAKTRLQSYKQLPVTYFQIGPKFRNELRSRGYLLRGKTFDMMDAYSFGRNQEDLDIEYNQIKKAYLEIFNQLGLKVQPVGADSGAIGGNQSEEFMLISDIGEDNILIDPTTGKAFNCELLEREDAKEYLKETYGIEDITKLKTTKAVELGHIFKLGDKYSKAMHATYIDKSNQEVNYVMGCYGIGVSRTLAMVYESNIIKNNNQIEGVYLPLNLTPYILYMIPKSDDPAKVSICEDIYEKLSQMGINVLLDDRDELSIGMKIKDSKVTGIPYVAVFGKTLDENYVTIENNRTKEKTDIALDDFINTIYEYNNYLKDNISLEEFLQKKLDIFVLIRLRTTSAVCYNISH